MEPLGAGIPVGPDEPSPAAGRPQDDGHQHILRTVPDKLFSDPTTALGVAGLLLYTVLWISYVTFYQPFGLTPDDLGWGYLDLLGQAAVSVVGLTVLAGGLFWVYFLIARVAVPVLGTLFRGGARPGIGDNDGDREQDPPGPDAADTATRPARGPRRHSLVSLLRGFAALVALAVYVWALFLAGGPQHTIALVATYCFLGASVIAAYVSWFRSLDATGRKRLDRQLARGVPIAMAGSFVVVAVVLVAQAAANAQDVLEGRSSSPTAFGKRLASWGADRATLVWMNAAAAARFPGLENECLMYLGQSEGTLYFYRPGTKETLRLPASDVAAMTKDVAEPCPQH